MKYDIVAAWTCEECEVEGRSVEHERPRCWNCGGPVVVTARPVIS